MCRRPGSFCSDPFQTYAKINNYSEIRRFCLFSDTTLNLAFVTSGFNKLFTSCSARVCVTMPCRLLYFQYFSFSCNPDLNPSAAAPQSNYEPFTQMCIKEFTRKADLDFEVCSLEVWPKRKSQERFSSVHLQRHTCWQPHAGTHMVKGSTLSTVKVKKNQHVSFPVRRRG